MYNFNMKNLLPTSEYLQKTIKTLKKFTIKNPYEPNTKNTEKMSENERNIEYKKYGHFAKLNKNRIEAKIHLVLCEIYTDLNKFNNSLNSGRLAITHTHNMIMETASLCKIYGSRPTKYMRSVLKDRTEFLQPNSNDFLYTTVSKLHTFNMKDFEGDTGTMSVKNNTKVYYFDDELTVIEKLTSKFGPILKQLMNRITYTEKHLNKDKEDIVEFANSLSPKSRPHEKPENFLSTLEELKRKKASKIKRRDLIGIKSNKDWINSIKMSDFLVLQPLTFEHLKPDYQNIVKELHRDSIYEKVVLLIISYYLYGKKAEQLFEKTKLGKWKEECVFWLKNAAEICCEFLPENTQFVQQILNSYQNTYSKLQKLIDFQKFTSNKENIRTKSPQKIQSPLNLLSPNKPLLLSKKVDRTAKVYTALGTHKKNLPFSPRSQNTQKGKTPMKYLQAL